MCPVRRLLLGPEQILLPTWLLPESPEGQFQDEGAMRRIYLRVLRRHYPGALGGRELQPAGMVLGVATSGYGGWVGRAGEALTCFLA